MTTQHIAIFEKGCVNFQQIIFTYQKRNNRPRCIRSGENEMLYNRWISRWKRTKNHREPIPPSIQDAHQSGRWDIHWLPYYRVLVLLALQPHQLEWKRANTDSKIQWANMGPTWVLSAPDGPHVGPINLAIRECLVICMSLWPLLLRKLTRI